MLYNDLKLTLRHFWHRKIYSVVILLSLSIGFTCNNLLTSFLLSEINTDNFHLNKDRSFQLFSNDPFGGKGNIPYIHQSVGNYLTETYPEVKSTCQVFNIENVSLETRGNDFDNIDMLSADPTFFTLFSYPLIRGTTENALSPDGIVLSQEKASLLFGNVDPVGKTINIKTPDTTKLVTVTAVFAERPEKSHLKFDALIQTSDAMPGWGGRATYLIVEDPSQVGALKQKLNSDAQRPGLLEKMDYSLHPLKEAYFNPDNKMPYAKTRSRIFIWVCACVCGLIFFIASFNFINLFLLSVQERKKESGIKKTLGASLNSLIRSSMVDVCVYVFTAFLLSIAFTSSLMAAFNSVMDGSITLHYLFRWDVLISNVLLIFCLASTVIVLSAWQQWKTRPVSLMKNSVSPLHFNKVFFLLQFVVSATLIICATTIVRQMNFVENAPLGFNKHIIQIKPPSPETAPSLATLKQNLSRIPSIGSLTLSNGNPISGNSIVRYELKDGTFYTPYLFSGDEDLIKTLDLTLLQGTFAFPSKPGKVVNETFVKQFDFKDPVGERIPGSKDDIIIGVVKDFTCGSFKEKIPPVILSFDPQARGMLVSYKGQDVSSVLQILEQEWKKVFTEQAFAFRIIQQDLLSKYKEEKFVYGIVILSSIISVVISVFGLFALSWAVVQSRVKEIGVRKVLGATASDILTLLTKSFVKRIVLAFAIAAPLGFYLMKKWLENFESRIDIDATIFIYSGMIVTTIALITLSLQTVKASLLNPVDELKSE